MSLARTLARLLLSKQLARPSGIVGRYFMGRFLNRATAKHNAAVLELLDVGVTDRVLEVGFGGGALLEKIAAQAPNGFVAGVELSDAMIARARVQLRAWIEADRLEVRHGSVDALPYPDASFSKACSVNTVYFWTDLDRALGELARVLRPGGRLVLGYVSDEDVRGAGLEKRGFKAYTSAELSGALLAGGFRPGKAVTGTDPRGTFVALPAERVQA